MSLSFSRMHIYASIFTLFLGSRLIFSNAVSAVQNDLDPSSSIVGENLEIWEGKYDAVLKQPRHVHISYGDKPSEMMITWSTIDETKDSIVQFGIHQFNENKVKGYSTEFVERGHLKLKQYIHRVKLQNLLPGQKYVYHCGSDEGWSGLFYFRAMPDGTDWSPTLAVYGDLGNENAQSLTRLQQEVELGVYDAILHVGDFAYDLDTDDGLIGDSFMEQIEPLSYVPYMTCPGNHEFRGNFTQYKNRFSMPGNSDSLMYSWNMGPIHFVSFSTEVYYFLQYGIKPVLNQYEWLKQDLEEANKPESRALRPWIIVYGHRPMYCSSNYTDDCVNRNTLVRVGIPGLHLFGLEDLFMENGVDLAIWGHQHSYERMWPVYNYTVYDNSTADNPYYNPKAVVHVTTGSAGCKEKHAAFTKDVPAFIAFRNHDYGYSRLKVLNKTHLYFEQVSDEQDGKVVDSFTIIRTRHESYSLG